jgi:hypothetical protein
MDTTAHAQKRPFARQSSRQAVVTKRRLSDIEARRPRWRRQRRRHVEQHLTGGEEALAARRG